MDNISDETAMNEIQNYPLLYDKSLREYKDQTYLHVKVFSVVRLQFMKQYVEPPMHAT